MRYMIYESNHAHVLLTREIEYMENYISLERLRLNNQIPIRSGSTAVKNKIFLESNLSMTLGTVSGKKESKYQANVTDKTIL